MDGVGFSLCYIAHQCVLWGLEKSDGRDIFPFFFTVTLLLFPDVTF